MVFYYGFFYFSKILKIKSFNSYYIIMYPPGGPVEVSGRGECPRPRTRPTASRFLSFSLSLSLSFPLSPFSLLPFLPPPLLQFSSLRIVLQNFHLPAINLLNARLFFPSFTELDLVQYRVLLKQGEHHESCGNLD